jgi:hypothetical protein
LSKTVDFIVVKQPEHSENENLEKYAQFFVQVIKFEDALPQVPLGLSKV